MINQEDKLNIKGFDEEMFSDLEFVLDFDDSANFALNDLAYFLKDRYNFEFDIGEPIVQPNITILNKKIKLTP